MAWGRYSISCFGDRWYSEAIDCNDALDFLLRGAYGLHSERKDYIIWKHMPMVWHLHNIVSSYSTANSAIQQSNKGVSHPHKHQWYAHQSWHFWKVLTSMIDDNHMFLNHATRYQVHIKRRMTIRFLKNDAYKIRLLSKDTCYCVQQPFSAKSVLAETLMDNRSNN